MARIAVVGSGAWGTALACHLARLEHVVTMWAYEPEVAEEISTRHTNAVYLPDVALPESIRASADAAEVAASGDIVILVPPSSHLRGVSAAAAPSVWSEITTRKSRNVCANRPVSVTALMNGQTVGCGKARRWLGMASSTVVTSASRVRWTPRAPACGSTGPAQMAPRTRRP